MQDLLEVGQITKAHGIKGEVCIDHNTESSDLLLDFVYLADSRAKTPLKHKKYTIQTMRVHHARLLVKFAEVPDRTAAELLRNYSVFIPLSRLPEAGPDEFYYYELIGLQIFISVSGGEHRYLGRLEAIEDASGQEVWTILTKEGKEILFPAVPEFVLDINLETEKIIINPPDGLLEIYLG